MGSKLDEVQAALKNTIFEPMFIVAFIGVAVALLKKLARRNLPGILAELGKVVLVMAFAALLAGNTSEVLGKTATIARDLGLSAALQMNGRAADANAETFVDETVGVLWGDLIHGAWKEIEFSGGDPSGEEVDAILSEFPDSEARQEAVDKYIEAHPGVMSKGSAWRKLPIVLIYALATFVKLAVYVACSMAVVMSQLLSVFFSLLGVVILLLSLFESLGGLGLIGDWLKRMLEIQLATLVSTMLLGFVIWLGSILDSAVGHAGGWAVGLLIQCILIVGLFLGRKKLFSGLLRAVDKPRAAARRLAGASVMDIASELPAGLAGTYLGNSMGGTQQSRLDVKEQKSRIAVNAAQEAREEAQRRAAEEERELAVMRQATEAQRHDEQAARAAQRQAREQAQKRKKAERDLRNLEKDMKAHEKAGTKKEAERPQTTPQAQPEEQDPEQMKPDIPRPTTTQSEAEDGQWEPDTVRPVTPTPETGTAARNQNSRTEQPTPPPVAPLPDAANSSGGQPKEPEVQRPATPELPPTQKVSGKPPTWPQEPPKDTRVQQRPAAAPMPPAAAQGGTARNNGASEQKEPAARPVTESKKQATQGKSIEAPTPTKKPEETARGPMNVEPVRGTGGGNEPHQEERPQTANAEAKKNEAPGEPR